MRSDYGSPLSLALSPSDASLERHPETPLLSSPKLLNEPLILRRRTHEWLHYFRNETSRFEGSREPRGMTEIVAACKLRTTCWIIDEYGDTPPSAVSGNRPPGSAESPLLLGDENGGIIPVLALTFHWTYESLKSSADVNNVCVKNPIDCDSIEITSDVIWLFSGICKRWWGLLASAGVTTYPARNQFIRI